MNKELVIPSDATLSDESKEVLRAWMLDKATLRCSVRVATFDNPSPWGLVLADIAREIAKALHEEHSFAVEDALDSIRYVFNAELLNPSEEGKQYTL